MQPVLDQAAGDRVEARHAKAVVVGVRDEPVAGEPAGVLELAVIEDVGGRNKSGHGDVKLCGRLEGIRPRATEISPDSPALQLGEGGARASGRVRGIPGDSGRITPERAAKRGGEGGSRHGRPRSLRGSARLWQETSKDCKQR